ncbi:hypothetical protein BTE54_20480 [Agrobacterium sp. YIC 4121]|nr:hypothetical protein BTE54_20480 [Agrobacterium sp. YIC 4121]
MMKMTMLNSTTRSLTSVYVGGLMLLVMTGCSVADDDRYSDSRRCTNYRDYSDCMSTQRHYRDREQLINQEKALINAAQARENLRMLREIRRRRGEQ